MKTLLLQLDGKIPNIALMRLAAHCRDRGDDVELRRVQNASGVERGMWDHFGQVYASLIFQRTRPLAERLLKVYPNAIVGGTGWDLASSLEQHGVETLRQDYSDYPKWRQSIGFSQRGCRLDCSFCVVPRKEGKPRAVSSIYDLWRGEPWPKEIILLDNDFFGVPEWKARIREMIDGDFKVSFNQGINCRMLNDESAEAIASVKYRDDQMKRPMLYTAWDSRKDEATLFRGLKSLTRYGVKPDNITVYMLIGYWADETDDDWLYRQQTLQDFGCRPYPMPYVRNSLTVGFQRWVVRRAAHKCSWKDFKAANCRPEKMKQRLELSLFD